MRLLSRFLLAVILPLATLPAAEAPKAPLLAGAATSNITPELGDAIVGGFLPFPAAHVHDELHARCLVLDDGKTRLALVVCDLLGLHRSVAHEARKLIEAETGIPATHVVVSGTHTHSATNAAGTMPRTYVSDIELSPYQRFVARRVADGVRRAINLLRPAEIAFGRVNAPEHVHNRRWHMKDAPPNPFGKVDRVKMNPPSGSPNLIEPAGPTDPEVCFFALREPGGNLIALYSAYSLHYVGGVGPAHISADYYGHYCETLQRRIGGSDDAPAFVAMMANGTSGDINNVNFREPRPRKAPYEQIRYVAEDIADKVHGALAGLEWSASAPLAVRYRELDVKWRPVEPELVAWAENIVANAPRIQGKVDLPHSYATRVLNLAKSSPETKFPVQVLRLGDICIGTSPCETFAETGLEFKKRSPFAKSFMVELANGYYGYMPTPRHFELGGYETWPGTNNVEQQASVKLIDAVLDMAAEVKAAN
jgi:neutral ceramidase